MSDLPFVAYVRKAGDGFEISIRLNPEPEVVTIDVTPPAWRLAVDLAQSLMETPDHDGFDEGDVALWNCFDLLRDLVAPGDDNELQSLLARFVAVCEAQTRDRFGVTITDPLPDTPHFDVQSLGRLLTSPPAEPWWYRAGQYAAAWLRSITESEQ